MNGDLIADVSMRGFRVIFKAGSNKHWLGGADTKISSHLFLPDNPILLERFAKKGKVLSLHEQY